MGHVLTVPSFAKINLGLRVFGRRPDGFHDICTIFQTVSLHDTITFEPADDINLTVSDPTVPADRSNLIVRAAERLREHAGTQNGASIYLEKRIPSPGGLGGGSSNGAVALLALNRMWQTGASNEELTKIAAVIGSDVPFFLHGGTALGTGRGADVTELPDAGLGELIIVTPDVGVETAKAFTALGRQNLTSEESNRILLNCRFWAEDRGLASEKLTNDFEETVFLAYPEIRAARDELLKLGAERAALSGSGASVFGIFDNAETRQTAMKALGKRPNWRSFAVAAISREEYREALEQVF